MLWLLNRTGTAVIEKVKTSSGSGKWQFSVQLLTAGTGCLVAQVFPLPVHPWHMSFPCHHSPLSMFYLGCPGTFSLFIFFPIPTVPVDEGISTRLLSLTHPSFENKHGHWWPGSRKLEQPVASKLGGLASPGVLWSRLWPRERILLAQGANIWQNKTVSLGQGGGVGWGKKIISAFFKRRI